VGKVLASIAVEPKPRLVAAANESLPKIASDWKKPDGLFLIRSENIDSFLWPAACRALGRSPRAS